MSRKCISILNPHLILLFSQWHTSAFLEKWTSSLDFYVNLSQTCNSRTLSVVRSLDCRHCRTDDGKLPLLSSRLSLTCWRWLLQLMRAELLSLTAHMWPNWGTTAAWWFSRPSTKSAGWLSLAALWRHRTKAPNIFTASSFFLCVVALRCNNKYEKISLNIGHPIRVPGAQGCSVWKEIQILPNLFLCFM